MPYGSAAFLTPMLRQKTNQRLRGAGISANAGRPHREGSYALKRKVHDIGRQIQHLTALFHDLESHFEHEGTALRFDGPHPSSVDSGIGPKRPLTPMPTPADGDLSETAVRSDEYEPFFAAVKTNCVEEVQMHLQQVVGPNVTWTNVSVIKKKFFSVTPLAMAVLQGNAGMVRMLVENKASLESEYSFAAGAEQKECRLPVTHACVPSERLDILRDLIRMNADVHAAGSNGANLVWQAAHFGHTSILEYLLDSGVSVQCSTVSQDNSELAYSPLHVATINGHGSIVSLLLESQADVLEDDGQGRQPLDDAVRHGHAGIVKELVMNNGDLFGTRSANKSADILATYAEGEMGHKSCLTKVFDSNNPVLISMAAKGLRASFSVPGKPTMLDSLTSQDLLRFLQAPGSAPMDAMEAIFQPYHLWYWEENNGQLCRKQAREAFLDLENKCNLMEGPHYRKILKLFNEKQPLDDAFLKFMNDLLPRAHRWKQASMFVPATAYMCHVPMIHKDLRVLLALAECSNGDIFSTTGCQAIINWKWMSEKSLARFRMVIAFIEVANFMAINVITDENSPLLVRAWLPLLVANVLSLIIWVVAMFMELAQILGYMSNGRITRYLLSPRHWFDFLVLLMTGSVSIVLLRLQQAASEDPSFCTALGVLVFMKWLRFLVYLRQIKAIGIQILPIMQTMWDIGPFLVVLSIYLLATVNMFYALNNGYSFAECFMLMYRLVVLGDASVAELENQAAPQLAVNLVTGTVTESTAPATDNFVIVQIMLVFVSFVAGVSLMNLFLAMLCLSYSLAHDQAGLSFMRSRLWIVLDQHALRVGITRLFCCWKQRTEMMVYGSTGSEYDVSVGSSSTRSIRTSANMIRDIASSRHAFLWFAVQNNFQEEE